MIEVTKEKRDHTNIIKFRFRAFNQLFEESDPMPIPQREISECAEENIFSYVDEFGITKKVGLVIEFPEKEIPSGTEPHIIQAIQNHFRLRLPQIKHDMILIKREGIYSCIITAINWLLGLLYLYLVYIGVLSMERIPGIFVGFILIIANWSSMWNSYEFFFYDFRNTNRKKMMYKKITQIPITIKTYTEKTENF